VVLFFVLGCLLLQEPEVREYRHRQVGEGTTACSARGCWHSSAKIVTKVVAVGGTCAYEHMPIPP